jgi:hypothetical protein
MSEQENNSRKSKQKKGTRKETVWATEDEETNKRGGMERARK